MRKQCKNCNKPNHFVRMWRSQQISDINEATESSEEENNLIQTLGSSDEPAIVSIEQNANQMVKIDRYN